MDYDTDNATGSHNWDPPETSFLCCAVLFYSVWSSFLQCLRNMNCINAGTEYC
ncbi:hypothetical protein T07_13557 [Trichinella nelsoni]|uniref:Uncharacterized protein n=1 Tax=Trichinella nelsoni TaxID=6336 RepID=A0A0V0RCK8_9BILA|nr:hypothetical protein T07_13557 [Trichinella nelsoni]